MLADRCEKEGEGNTRQNEDGVIAHPRLSNSLLRTCLMTGI